MSDQVALEYHQPGSFDAHQLLVPAGFLAACEGRTADPVSLEPRGDGKVLASWIDRGIPQSVEYEAVQEPGCDSFPSVPDSFEPNTPELYPALKAALAIVPQDRSRYALDCLQLRGADGKLVVTDGRQILVQSGFQFPWTDELLVPASKVLACNELYREGPSSVGIAGDWVVFRSGPWTVWLPIEREARFPKIDDLIRQPTTATSRLRIDPLDAEFLAGTLDRLPCDNDLNQAVTLDLNGQMAVRGRPAAAAQSTELILSRSTLEGEPIAIATNREFLARALKLEFHEVCLFGPRAPAVCDDGRRQYVWALIDPESVVRRSEEAIRIESAAYGTPSPNAQPKTNRRRFTVTRAKSEPAASASNGKHHKPKRNGASTDSTISPIAQAVALRTSIARGAGRDQ